MAILSILFLFFILLVLLKKNNKRATSMPQNWPVLGMLPGLVANVYRLHDFITDILQETGGTFEFIGPWFCDMDYVVTSDPTNIHHVLSRNFSNYPKGDKFRNFFDILGNGVFNVDSESWEIHRRITMSVMNHVSFKTKLEKTIWDKVEDGLIPVLDHHIHHHQRRKIDLQDIFQRFTFDSISKLLLDYDPGSLSIDLPYVPCEKAFNDTMEAILYRHALPETIWRLQKWLGIGKEKKLNRAKEAFDSFIYSALEFKEQSLIQDPNSKNSPEMVSGDCIAAFKEEHKNNSNAFSDELRVFLRDTVLNLMLAGRDTTSTGLTWLIWLLVRNPTVKTKVMKEIESVLGNKGRMLLTVEESHKLVYLHGAICEALRLFPPVPLEHKSPSKPDILPCGIQVEGDRNLILSFYSMGRMESIWGRDCLEFNPERWISKNGKIKHEPSYKFTAFNAGPRTCLGKEMAFIQMKMVVTAILTKYDIELVKDHVVAPSDSIILQMKQGFPVMLSSRKSCLV